MEFFRQLGVEVHGLCLLVAVGAAARVLLVLQGQVRFKTQDSRFKIQVSRFKIQDTGKASHKGAASHVTGAMSYVLPVHVATSELRVQPTSAARTSPAVVSAGAGRQEAGAAAKRAARRRRRKHVRWRLIARNAGVDARRVALCKGGDTTSRRTGDSPHRS